MKTLRFTDGSTTNVDDKVADLIATLSEKNRGTTKGVEAFIARFKQKYIYCDLVRIGGEGDGGYLLPDIMNRVSYCFSPGVDDVSTFEQELSQKYNIKSYMADASVEKAPVEDENFNFIPKFLGSVTRDNSITLTDWMQNSIGNDKSQKILQMDIEGGEYDVLTLEDSQTLASFSAMVIEFHYLEQMFQPLFLKMLSAIFEKIYNNFSICHVHPNNCCGIATLDGVPVPRVIEVTFIRNDLVPRSVAKNIELPHELDRKNILLHPDLIMPEIWWK
ncbi:FkbM family methyltransferase [SAR116 cluster bacterium]|nr:FkbM family methyltransferase [SAR116 cluster bacterium]